MPRRITPQANQTTHITVRCNNKKYLFNLEDNFSDIVSWLNSLTICYDVQIHHVLFMSNHFHLMATPTKNNFGDAMSYFLTNTAKFLNFKNGSINHIFGNRYGGTMILNERHLINVIRYIYQNPLRAKLTNSIASYPYSSLGFYNSQNNPGIILSPDNYTLEMFGYGIGGYLKWFEWIENCLSSEDSDHVKKSLSRSIFKFTVKQQRAMNKNGTSLIS